MGIDEDREALKDIGKNAAVGKTGLVNYLLQLPENLVGLIWKPENKDAYTTAVQPDDAAAITAGFTEAGGQLLGGPDYGKSDPDPEPAKK